MSVTTLGLNNQPVKFLGAYVRNVSTSLGLTSSPSTCGVTIIEDPDSLAVFQEPTLGKYYELNVGSRFSFGGIITKFDRDVRNISGRQISINMSDPREIMRSIPMIIAPGYRDVAGRIVPTQSSLIDIFGAYDDFETTGLNLSGWNQAGMEVRRIISALHGEDVLIGDSLLYSVEQRYGKAFGEIYRFNLTEVKNRIDGTVRINSNLLSIADFVQELANRGAFDWYTECSRAADNVIDVTIKVIDRRTDNISIDLEDFLADNADRVISARSGIELRNDIAVSVLLGAPIESIRAINVDGMANESIDLSEEGGPSDYTMNETEIRVVLAGKQSWETWVAIDAEFGGGGGYSRYIEDGNTAFDDVIQAVFDHAEESMRGQSGKNPNRNHDNLINQERENSGKIYEKLKGYAENTYGKRFVFSNIVDVDKIDAAWTFDVVGGNGDADEFFRNEQGKTRCYVEFASDATTNLGFQVDLNNIFGGQEGIVFPGQAGYSASNYLVLELVDSFARNTTAVTNWMIDTDKKNWFVDSNGKLFVAATIEDNSNIVRLESPVLEGSPDANELYNMIVSKIASTHPGAVSTADGVAVEKSKKAVDNLLAFYGGNSLQIFAKAFQPKNVYIPTRAKYLRYGPVFSTSLSNNTVGKCEVEVDDGFAPWEFGGFTVMLDAMQIKVDNQSSTVRTVQTADITVEGFPEYSIGEALGRNSNINNVNISFGDGVTTQYQLQSFLRKFGELSKEDLARLSLFARRGGARNLPQDTVAFIDKYRTRINMQNSGRGSLPDVGTTGGVGSFD